MPDLVLEIVEGPGAGTQVALSGPIDIGRDPTCGLALEDDLVSRRHARVVPQNGGALAEDLGSTNGTFLNGAQVHGPIPIATGDHLLVGVTVLELRTAADVQIHRTAVRPRPAAFAVPPRKPDYVAPELALDQVDDRARQLDSLLDVRTKHRARMAPLGIALLVAFAVILFLALR